MRPDRPDPRRLGVAASWLFYILVLADGACYVGKTVNLARRLREHRTAAARSPIGTYIRVHGGIRRVVRTPVRSLTREKSDRLERCLVFLLRRKGLVATCWPTEMFAPYCEVCGALNERADLHEEHADPREPG